MARERLSLREASHALGVSQVRVRELIRKGRLEAEKVADEAGERWALFRHSVDEYRQRREQDNSPEQPPPTGEGSPRRAGGASADLTALTESLEQQIARLRTLAEEISTAQTHLDGLRDAQRTLERELEGARRKVEPKGAEAQTPRKESEAQAPAPDPKAQPVPEAPKKQTNKDQAPKEQAKKAEATKRTVRSHSKSNATSGSPTSRSTKKGSTTRKESTPSEPDTLLGSALRKAGVTESTKTKSTKAKGKQAKGKQKKPS